MWGVGYLRIRLGKRRVNLYAYVANSPLNWIDVLGLCPDIELNPSGYGTTGVVEPQRIINQKDIDDPVGQITINGHGSPQSMLDQRAGVSGKRVNPADLAQEIMKREDFKDTKRVVLYSCNTGRGENSFAEQLSKLLGKPVYGANRFLNLKRNRKYEIDDREMSPPGTSDPGQGRGGWMGFGK